MKIIADIQTYEAKEALYIAVRQAEGRVISNEILKTLPFIDTASLYKNEWDIRVKNFIRLVTHLEKSFKHKPLQILDIGCGNGWMSHRLSEKGHSVTALDLNLVELKQAEEVFGESPKLEWVYANILKDKLSKKYDVVLFSASCQYFENLEELTDKLWPLLKQNGEIHFHDSVFYKEHELEAAKERSIQYYTKLGFPAMAMYYFHHSKNSMKKLGYRNMNQLSVFLKKNQLEWWMKKKLNVS